MNMWSAASVLYIYNSRLLRFVYASRPGEVERDRSRRISDVFTGTGAVGL